MFKIIDLCKKNNNKLLIIVGHTLSNTRADPDKYATYKYFIESEPAINYKQYISRTYSDICAHCKSIKHVIEKESNVYKIDLLLIHKYKIRPSPPYIGFIHNINRAKIDAEKNKYIIMNVNNIYADIIKKL